MSLKCFLETALYCGLQQLQVPQVQGHLLGLSSALPASSVQHPVGVYTKEARQ